MTWSTHARHLTAVVGALLLSALAVPTPAQDAARSSQVFRSSTRLIQVSVVVHDGRKRPVEGLRQEDFQVFEDGKPVPVAFFSMRSGDSGKAAAAAPGVFSNRIQSPSSGGVVAIVYDRLNTARFDQTLVREHIIKYLGQVNPDDRVGLYVLDSRGMRVLHDFTRDARSLLRVLSRVRGTDSAALDGSEATLPEHIGFGDAIDRELDQFVRGAEANMRGFYERDRALTSIDGLEMVAKHLAGVPGRKNLVWVSGGFPFEFRAFQPATTNHQELMSRETGRAARVLNDADVAVYVVDARGLVGAFSSRPAASAQTFTTIDTVLKPIEGLRKFADLTGGAAFFNTNDLGNAIRRAVEDSRLTYVIGYYTPNETWDGKFREIKVKIARRGVDVRHRTGYFAIPPVVAGLDTRADAIMDALESPLEATALPFDVILRPAGEKMTLLITLQGSAPALELRDGRWRGSLDIAVAQTLPSGQQTKEADVTVPLSLDEAARARMLEEGLQLTVSLTPRGDAHDARVVVRDSSTGATGSVIIPAARLRPTAPGKLPHQ